MKVLIVDDHTLVRHGIALLVKECFRDAEVREAGSADEAIDLMKVDAADVALVDVRMPERDGLELLREIKADLAEGSRDHADDVRPRDLREAGPGRRRRRLHAEGCLARGPRPGDPRGDGGRRQRALRAGDPFAVRELGAGRQEKDQPVRPESLTQRETDILALLSEGRSNREIARALFLSEKTVKAHLAAVFRKLGVANRTQAAMAAVSMGMGPGRKQPMDDDDEPMAGQRQVGTWRS